MSSEPIDCRVMSGPERLDAFTFMRAFRADERALGDALTLFVEREDFGFVWLAYRSDTLVGCASVGYGVASTAGGLVGVVRDLYVAPPVRRAGIASALLAALETRLTHLGVTRIEIAANGDAALLAFLAARGYRVTAGVFARPTAL